MTATPDPGPRHIRDSLPARPTLYRGIAMRSRLEARWADALDRQGFDWEYEPCAFAAPQSLQYLPDFRYRVARPGGRTKTVYLAVKGSCADLEAVRRRMEVIWASEPDASLCLFEDASKTMWWGHLFDRSAIWEGPVAAGTAA